jgi:KaiC/GvpD/RAD55 family RecA-like ATPase
MPPLDALDRPITITFFKTFAASEKTEENLTFRALAERIRTTGRARKEWLPWLKLARFGDDRTEKNSLRHDANIIAITGIEADYDGGVVTINEAVEALTKQGIAAMAYSSPSHTPEAPRWRVLCPLSTELPPDQRTRMLGRLNGLLGGILAGESFTLSQSYYFGSVNNNPYHTVELIGGTPIDFHDDLDEIWQGRPGTKDTGSTGPGPQSGPIDEATLIRQITEGAAYHLPMMQLTGHWATSGVGYVEVNDRLHALMQKVPEATRDDRWQSRLDDIPTCLLYVFGARFKEKSQAKPETEAETPREKPKPITATTLLTMDIPPRKLLLDPYLPEAGSAMIYAPRGIGKTWVSLSIAYAVAAGCSVLGGTAREPRRVLFIDGEMPLVTLQNRLASIAVGMGHEPPSDDFLRFLPADYYREGLPDLASPAGRELILDLTEGVALVIFDNLSALSSGKENEADSWQAMQDLVLTLRRRGTTTLLIHHAGKAGQQRGTSRREDVLDTVISLRRPDDYTPSEGARVHVHFEKARGFMGDDAAPFEARLQVENGAAIWTCKPLAKSREAMGKEMLANGAKISDVMDATKCSRSTAFKWQAELKEGETNVVH